MTMECRHGVRPGEPAICESEAVCVIDGEVLCGTHAQDWFGNKVADLNRNHAQKIADLQYKLQLALDRGVGEVDKGQKQA